MSAQVEIIVVSMNYHTTPIKIREQLSFKQEELCEAMRTLQEQEGIVENVILSTCNRTEIYAVLQEVPTGLRSLKKFLAHWFSLPLETVENYLVVYENDAAIEHLFRVSTGIDSMVVGETQILGQVRDSFLRGQSISTTKTVFNQLFREAIAFSKRVHAKSSIGEKAVSISYAAVQLLKQVVGDLHNQDVLVLGAGEMGELTLKNLKANGVKNITLINRTFSTAEEMAGRYGINAQPMDELESALSMATMVISSTNATEPIIQEGVMQSVMKNRMSKPCYLVDIAVPRDIDAEIAEIPAVHLYDIDDIQRMIDSNLAERQKIAKQIAIEIDDEVTQFNEWLAMLQAVPLITALQKKGEQIQQQILESLFNKMPQLTTREKKVLDNHTQSIVNQLLREPIREVKELALTEECVGDLTSVEKLFGFEKVERNKEEDKLATLAKERLRE